MSIMEPDDFTRIPRKEETTTSRIINAAPLIMPKPDILVRSFTLPLAKADAVRDELHAMAVNGSFIESMTERGALKMRHNYVTVVMTRTDLSVLIEVILEPGQCDSSYTPVHLGRTYNIIARIEGIEEYRPNVPYSTTDPDVYLATTPSQYFDIIACYAPFYTEFPTAREFPRYVIVDSDDCHCVRSFMPFGEND